MPPSATASGADAGKDASSARNREHNQGNQERKCTPEQKAAVLRIRRCKPTDFYEILDIEAVRKTCTESEIKKAYRKQSLLTHPDKNGHEKADEAFKMVARAFSVLGDKEKRDRYDRFGGDPDSRFGQAQAQAQNPFGGFGQRQAAGGGMGGGMDEGMSPEEMFARFFGGGGFGGGGGPFGGGFDTGPAFTFNFGGPGVRVHQFGGGRPRRRPRENQGAAGAAPDTSLLNTIMGLLPILVLFLFPLLSSIFSGSSSTPAGPRMVFDMPEPPYTMERVTPKLKVKYYVNPLDVKTHSKSKFARLDSDAEVVLVRHLRAECENEIMYKQRLYDEAQGWFTQDPDKMEVANRFEAASCRRLDKMGVLR